MKDLKVLSRLDTRLPIRSVSLQIRDCQVTIKVRTSVPQVRSSAVRLSVR